MTDTASLPPPPAFDAASSWPAQWQRLPDAAAAIEPAFLTEFIAEWPLLIGVVLLACIAGTWLGYRSWKFSAWKLDDTGLHVRRGRWWQREVLVPRSRVQHLDIERGPIERNFGLATLVVHTAGIRTHALRQPGFADADAVALRDALVPASARHDDVV